MTDHEKAKSHSLLMLGHEPGPSKERVGEIARLAIQVVSLTSPRGAAVVIDEALLIRELEALVTWRVGRDFVIDSDEDHVPWLPARRGTTSWKFWDRYRRYLLEKSKPLPPAVVESVDDLTDKVLGRLEDPARDGPWDRRGMIVGHVQSGKTSNFIGLICKAADAGYRVIVVLAGMHENLRAQTQMRVDEGFLGYSAAEATAFSVGNKPIGVGKIVTDYRAPAHSLTGYGNKQDFNRAKASGLNVNPHGHDPVILVVKKNTTILDNLITWLATHAEIDPANPKRRSPMPDVPLLVIDDEADNGSINTKDIPIDEQTGQPLDEYDVTKVNGKIRQLLSLFSKSVYVGYTATPFANIFIHPDDRSEAGTIGKGADVFSLPYGEGLFPRSFIISLPTPDNYVGPATIFGMPADPDAGIEKSVTALPLTFKVEDAESWIPPKHKKDLVPGPLPDSLRRAIRSFVIACAARVHRGAGREHSSMLVHVTRFIDVQKQVLEQVSIELKDIVNRLRYGDGQSKSQLLEELAELWNEDVPPATEAVLARHNDPEIVRMTWEDVRPHLSAAAQKIVVKRISGGSEDVLDYQNSPDGASVIAVGGDKLSRGLTLEGLAVSYFLRPSTMYDTLMQMGRWFGYRPGYLDLCRLYTTGDLVEWYRHIALAAEELRREFELMVDSNRTPRDYGLRVRSHPNGLWITSLVKMREARTLTVSYDGRISETTVLHRDHQISKTNVDAVNRLLQTMPDKSLELRKATQSIEWSAVPATTILSFLREYRTHPHAPKVNSALLSHYVAGKVARGELKRWTVVLIASALKDALSSDKLLYQVHLVQREDTSSGLGTKYTVQRLLSPADEQYGLSNTQLDAALAHTRESWKTRSEDKRSKGEPADPSGPALRLQRSLEEGLLLVYPLDPHKAGLGETLGDIPVVGIGISFPGDQLNPSDGVEYEANLVYVGKELGDEDFE